MPSTRNALARAKRTLKDILTINKKKSNSESNSRDDDSASDTSSLSSLESNSSDAYHDYQPRIIGQTPTQYLITFINPDDTARFSWVETDDSDESLVQHWQKVQAYVKPFAAQRAIEDGLWYIDIHDMILILDNSLYDTVLQAITSNHGEDLKLQIQLTYSYGDGVARMVVGHDRTHYLVLEREPGQEVRAKGARREDILETLQEEYWLWYDAIKAAEEDHQGDEENFRPDLLLLEGEGVFVAMSRKVASEAVLAVIRGRHPELFRGEEGAVS